MLPGQLSAGLLAQLLAQLLAGPPALPAQLSFQLDELSGAPARWQVPTRRGFLHPAYGRVPFALRCAAERSQELMEQGFAQLFGFDPLQAERSFRQALAEEPPLAMAAFGVALCNARRPSRAAHWAGRALLLVEHARPANQRLIRALAACYETDRARAEREKAARLGRENPEYDPYEPPKRQFRRSPAQRQAAWRALLAEGSSPEERLLEGLSLCRTLLAGAPEPAREALRRRLLAICAALPKPGARHPAQCWPLLVGATSSPRQDLARIAAVAPHANRQLVGWLVSGRYLMSTGRHQDADVHLEAGLRACHGHLDREQAMPFSLPVYAALVAARVDNLCALGRIGEALSLARHLAEAPRHPRFNHLAAAGSQLRRGLRLLLLVCQRFGLDEELSDLVAARLFDFGADPGSGPVALELARTWLLLGRTQAALSLLPLASARHAARSVKSQQGQDLRRQMQALWPQVLLLLEHAQLCGAQLPAVYRRAEPRPEAKLDAALAAAGLGRLARFDLRLRAGAAAAELALGSRPAAGCAELWRALRLRPKDLGLARRLRRLAGRGDFEHRVFEPMRELARAQGWAADWRQPRRPLLDWPRDIGPRPLLERLGPMRWQPSRPRPWVLDDAAGGRLDLSSWRGRAVLVINYLGFG